MATLGSIIQSRMSALDTAYQTERAKLQADLANLGPLLDREEAELKAWFSNEESIFASFIQSAKTHLGL